MAIIVPIISEWNPKGLDKSLQDIKRAEGGWSKTGAAFKSAFLPAVGVLSGIALATKGWITEAEGGRQASRRLEAVFKSMGDTTGAAAKAAEDYATALGNKIGVDDDDIKVTQAKLATFAAVSGEIGRQAGIFDRATAAAHDLAAAGFGDAAGNAVQLGKALQDPTKGITALARSGVTFTASEKEKIKALTASGHLLEAQKIVLGAVEHQVGGVAAATATSSQRMETSWKNTQEALGTVLLPAFDALSAVLQTIAAWMQDNSTAVMVLVGVIALLAGAVVAVNIAMKLYATAQAIATAATWLWNAALDANPIGLIILGIVLFIAAIALLWTKSEGFRNFVLGVWAAILGAVQAVWKWIQQNWPLLLAILLGPFGIAVAAIIRNWSTVKSALVSFYNWVRGVFSAVWTGVGRVVGAVTDAIKRAWQSVWDFVAGIFAKIQGVWDSISGILGHIPGLGSIFGRSTGGAVSSSYTLAYTPAMLGGPRSASAGGAGTVVNVYGALDPEAVARQLRGLLIDHDVRQGRTPIRRVAW